MAARMADLPGVCVSAADIQPLLARAQRVCGSSPRFGQWFAVFGNHHPVEVEIGRSEEHTSELQSQSNLVCRLLLEKKKTPLPAKRTTPSLTSARRKGPTPTR